MHGARDELFPRPRLAGDQHREVGRGDGGDLAPQGVHRRAATDQMALAAQRFLHQVVRDLPLAFARLFERPDQRHVAQRRRGKRGKGADGGVANLIEGPRVGGVEGQHADQFAVDVQATAEAGMHLLGRFEVAGQQTVEGVGQGAVGGKAQRRVGGQDLRQARVRRRGKAPPHQLGRQAVAGHRHQHIVLQVEQGHRIARQHLADRRHQALELHLAGHGGGEIDGDLPQGTIDGFLKTHGTPRKTPRGERISIAAPDWQVFDSCGTVFIYS